MPWLCLHCCVIASTAFACAPVCRMLACSQLSPCLLMPCHRFNDPWALRFRGASTFVKVSKGWLGTFIVVFARTHLCLHWCLLASIAGRYVPLCKASYKLEHILPAMLEGVRLCLHGCVFAITAFACAPVCRLHACSQLSPCLLMPCHRFKIKKSGSKSRPRWYERTPGITSKSKFRPWFRWLDCVFLLTVTYLFKENPLCFAGSLSYVCFLALIIV